MAKVARITRIGGPEVIEWQDVDLPPPGPGEVRIRTTAAGLNYIDTYHRDGTYPTDLPAALGMEGVGVVTALGDGVTELAVGTRVATFGPERGAYATERNIAARHLFVLPDDIDDETAAASLLKGCTAEFLAERASHVAPGDWVLVHAAAGGVGSILTQWLAAKGAQVIATVGDEAKADQARDHGATDVILYRAEDVAKRVRGLTGGMGVRVAYDGIGRDTWEASLDALAQRGLLISYGNASAPVTGVALGILAAKGSLFVTRPTLFHYYSDPAERVAGAASLWEMIRSGKVRVTIGQRYPLLEAAQAHTDLEARRTTGSTLLIP
ncbi:quinone oxidoreductase [Sphingomonas sp. SUN019]|uniref:quinone oxidoreductase family protein n=1 Tax=Sphingomonas sp. SUN019 TaxID=2937788 RepID=UPI002164D896|nr:quinone oxidoreductase [Sphingomonas sp. SUN019]UVO50882.1 quinone oxidoreductase [Sphingomonas sp. SUN019]